MINTPLRESESLMDLTQLVPQRNFGDYQDLIYARGRIDGVAPLFTTNLAKLPELASSVLAEPDRGVIFDNAGDGQLARDNVAAFDGWRLVPHQLRGSELRDHSVTVLGTPMPAPVLLGPVGVQTLAHPDGELASAAAAEAVGLTYVHSTQASHSIEDVADANGDGSRWFQLYWPDDDDLAISFLTRAESAGYTTLVLTLDTNVAVGYRPHDLDSGYLPFLNGIGVANYFTDPVFRASLERTPEADPLAAALRYASVYARKGLSWADLPFLRRHWSGPIVLKGILSVEDARLAVEAGMDGIVVSNHGGRQVSSAVTTLQVLPDIVDAVADRLSVLFDSGVRTGGDVTKALALGAVAVLIGRPFVAGLALGGRAGVEHVLRCLLADFDLTVALSGYSSYAEMGRDSLLPT